MTAPLNPLEQEVLDWVSMDFEAPHTIAADISRELGQTVTESDVRSALLSLARNGRVQAYRYESTGYRRITPDDAQQESQAWFKKASGS
jgi:hypothetical protein